MGGKVGGTLTCLTACVAGLAVLVTGAQAASHHRRPGHHHVRHRHRRHKTKHKAVATILAPTYTPPPAESERPLAAPPAPAPVLVQTGVIETVEPLSQPACEPGLIEAGTCRREVVAKITVTATESPEVGAGLWLSLTGAPICFWFPGGTGETAVCEARQEPNGPTWGEGWGQVVLYEWRQQARLVTAAGTGLIRNAYGTDALPLETEDEQKAEVEWLEDQAEAPSDGDVEYEEEVARDHTEGKQPPPDVDGPHYRYPDPWSTIAEHAVSGDSFSAHVELVSSQRSAYTVSEPVVTVAID